VANEDEITMFTSRNVARR